MADVSAVERNAAASTGAGPFSRLARAQYAALAAMRGRMLANSLRSKEGAFEFGARAVSYIVYGFMGLGLAIGAGAAAHPLVAQSEWQLLPIEFWVVCVLWQAMAIALASFQEQFDLSSLLRFPISFASFSLLYLVFGIIDIPTLIGGLCCVGIFVGATLARPDLAGWAIASLAVLAAFNVLLARAIFAWIERWLSRRRSREIVSALFLVAVVSLQLLNPALRDESNHAHRQMHAPSAVSQLGRQIRQWPARFYAVQAWLPPGLSATMLARGGEDDRRGFALATAAAGLYLLAIAALLSIRLHAEYRGESLSEAPAIARNQVRESRTSFGGAGPGSATVWTGAPRWGEVGAILEKELLTLSRSVPQIYAICVPALMAFVIGGLFRGGPGRSSLQLGLPVSVAYGLLGFTQLLYNNLGAEGPGIQLIFLSPSPVKKVLLGKNLFHAALYLVVALAAGVLASFRAGFPGPLVIADSAAWITFALPANLAAGDILSLTMPYRISPGRIGRQSGSQGNALLSMLIQATILGLGAAAIGLCGLFGKQWLAAPILLALAAAAVLAWLRVLHNVDRLANSRRDVLLAKLAKTE